LSDFEANERDAYFGEILFSHTCCTEHTSRHRGYIVMATGVLNLGISGLEDFIMRHMDRYISSLFLAAAIAAPTAIMADPRPQDGSIQVRIYDRDHRDYHNWDDHEDRAYRRYLAAQHRSYREYHRQHYRVQRHYWNWRHSHPDRD
jgi:hypothetical protein